VAEFIVQKVHTVAIQVPTPVARMVGVAAVLSLVARLASGAVAANVVHKDRCVGVGNIAYVARVVRSAAILSVVRQGLVGSA
jgi:hypothetical protein